MKNSNPNVQPASESLPIGNNMLADAAICPTSITFANGFQIVFPKKNTGSHKGYDYANLKTYL
jgi:hypothetical protein